VVTCAKSMGNDARIAPIFKVRSVTGQQLDPLYAYTHTHTHTQVSSVTGQQLDLLRLFLNLIPAQKTQGVYMSVDLFCLYSRSLLTLRKQERTLTRVLYRMCSL
jgi:GTPase